MSNNFVRNTGDDGAGHVVGDDRRTPATRSTTTPCRPRCSPTASPSTAAPTTRCPTTSSPTRSARAAPSRSAPASAPQPFAGHLWITDNTTVRAGTYELNWNIGLGAIWFYALEKNIDADIQVVGDHFLDNTYNAIMLVADWPVKDLYSITNVHFKDIRVDGTGTSVVSARVGRLGVLRERGRPQRRRGRHQQLRLVPLHPGRLGVLADRPRRQRRRRHHRPVAGSWELPNTITCDDRPPVVVPPAPSAW